MLVSFTPGQGPVRCTEHGDLPGTLLSDRDRRILLWEHLVKVHNKPLGRWLERERMTGFAVTSARP
jgi:hypothetical protein